MNALSQEDYDRCRFPIMFGGRLIDLGAPRPEDINIAALHTRLALIRRFSGDPRALTVSAHSRAVWSLALAAHAPDGVVRWCLCHDMHEAIIGDIPGPLKHFLAQHTDALIHLEIALDRAICGAMSIPEPTAEERTRVRFFDKLAETMEWVHVLKRPAARWNAPYTEHHLATFRSAVGVP